MPDYIKKYKALDKKYLQTIKTNLQTLQSIGAYPKRFTYPLTLQFELTGSCNLACKHCYNRSGDTDRETAMTPDKWCELAKEIVNDGGIFQCIISGGEPLLLGNRLFDIMDILHDDGTSFIVITNGLLLTKEVARKFNKYRYFWFQISIDGVNADAHDSFRGVHGSFEKAVNGALEISDLGIPLVIAHSVTPGTLDQVEEMVELAYSLGANSVILGEILASGRAIANPGILLNESQKNILYGKVEELSKKYKGKIHVQRSADLKMQMERYKGDVNSGGIIRPNGDFRLDCMAPFTIGNVLKKSIYEIWSEKGEKAWDSPIVDDYINSIDENNITNLIRNHVDKDISI